MKIMTFLIAFGASLTFTTISQACPHAAGAELTKCDEMAENTTEICKTYKEHRAVLKTLKKQLKADGLTREHVRAHKKAVKAVFKAVAADRSKDSVQKQADKLEDTSRAVLTQLGPLAKKWANYKGLIVEIVATEERFVAAVDAWLNGEGLPAE